MSSGKGAPTVLVTTHLPADFQGDVKSNTKPDSSLFPHPHCIQEQTSLSLPLAGKDAAHKSPAEKPTQSSVVHRSWVWTHRCFSCSNMQSSISAVVETAKTALHSSQLCFRTAGKLSKEHELPVVKATSCPFCNSSNDKEVEEAKKGQSTDDISCPMPLTAEQLESWKSSSLATFQRQMEIRLFVQDFLSCTHGYTRDSNFPDHTNEKKLTWGTAHVENSQISRVIGSTLLWGWKPYFCSLCVWLLEKARRESAASAGSRTFDSVQSRCTLAWAEER